MCNGRFRIIQIAIYICHPIKGAQSQNVLFCTYVQKQKNDGYINLEDLKSYQPRFAEPIQTNYRNHKVLAHPPPAGGAAVLLEGLNILENFETKGLGPNSAAFLHLFAEALQRGHMDRSRYMGDPQFYE